MQTQAWLGDYRCANLRIDDARVANGAPEGDALRTMTSFTKKRSEPHLKQISGRAFRTRSNGNS